MLYRGQRVALIVPCFNEEASIGNVIRDFRAGMPEIEIYVFDNCSTDNTGISAKAENAKVLSVYLRGKGNVVRRMFSDVEADVYVMVDGDGTYDAAAVCTLVDHLLDANLDMVVGCRQTESEMASAAYRPGHQWGNRLLTQGVNMIFGGGVSDMLSGYRVFSRRYAKSFPALSKGFEIETELTVHALELRMPFGEVVTKYGSRLEGSQSKLSTYKDGVRILRTILHLFVSEKPLSFFSICSFAFSGVAIILFIPIMAQFVLEGVVPRLPTAVLSASLMLSAMLSLVCGLVLDNVTRGRHENKRLAYLSIPRAVPKEKNL